MLRGALLPEEDRKALLSSDLRLNPFRHSSRDLVYRAEKAKGLRFKNGKKPLKRLSGAHLTAISLHVAGLTNNQIAALLGKSPAWVSVILSDPLSQREIDKKLSLLDQEFKALFSDVVQAIRDGLSSDQRIQDRLSAADKWLKAHGRYAQKREEEGATAEDVIQQVIALQQQQQVNVSISLSSPTQEKADGKTTVTLPPPGVQDANGLPSHSPPPSGTEIEESLE